MVDVHLHRARDTLEGGRLVHVVKLPGAHALVVAPPSEQLERDGEALARLLDVRLCGLGLDTLDVTDT